MGREPTTGGQRRHSAIGAAQTALTVLVVGGVALGALLLRPDRDLFAKGRGPLGTNPVLVVGLALLFLLGGLALREKYRAQVGVRELGPVEQRLVDGVSRVLLAASLVVPVLVVALHRFGPSGSGHGNGQGASPLPSPLRSPRSEPAPTVSAAQHAEHGTHFGPTRILPGLGIALIVVLVVIAGLYLRRCLSRPRSPEAPAVRATLDEEQERLVRAVDSGRRALLDGTDARAAVIACYAAMEESLAGSGVTRHASDAPQDLLERALVGGLPTAAAAAALTALFREARYSTHPMEDDHRDRAAAALAEIADGLRSRASGLETVTGAS